MEKVYLFRECTVTDPSRQGLLDALNTQRTEESLCDVVLVADEQKFPVHRCILAATSPYFRSMFEARRFTESDSKEIELYSVGKGALHEILNMIYTGKLYLDINNVHDILGAADHMLLNDAKDFCSEFMDMILKSNVATREVLKIRRSAELFSLRELILECDRVIGLNFSDIVITGAFYDISLVELRRLLENEDVKIGDEAVFWAAAISWFKYDLTNRIQHLDEIMQYIRFPLIDAQILITKIQVDDLMMKSTIRESLIEEAMKYQLLISYQSRLQTCRTKPRCTEGKTVIYCLAGIDHFMCFIPHHNRWYSLQAPTLQEAASQDALHYNIISVGAKVYAMGLIRITGEVNMLSYSYSVSINTSL